MGCIGLDSRSMAGQSAFVGLCGRFLVCLICFISQPYFYFRPAKFRLLPAAAAIPFLPALSRGSVQFQIGNVQLATCNLRLATVDPPLFLRALF